MAGVILENLEDAARLAAIIAPLLNEFGNPPVLFHGPPGCGKTTLIGKITAMFPGGENAETSSPTFTICNFYPAYPPIMHCDLYRCGQQVPEEAWEFMDMGRGQIFMEWAEYLPDKPPERLDIFIDVVNDARWLEFKGYGADSISIANKITGMWPRLATG